MLLSFQENYIRLSLLNKQTTRPGPVVGWKDDAFWEYCGEENSELKDIGVCIGQPIILVRDFLE